MIRIRVRADAQARRSIPRLSANSRVTTAFGNLPARVSGLRARADGAKRFKNENERAENCLKNSPSAATIALLASLSGAVTRQLVLFRKLGVPQ